jgi:DNA polymerase-4
VGIGANKTVARIGARAAKPAGQRIVPPGQEAEFLAPFPLPWLAGIRPDALATLRVAGVRTIGDLARAPAAELGLAIGSPALALQRRAQGVDEEPVLSRSLKLPQWRESIEFAADQWEERILQTAIRKLIEPLLMRLREQRLEARRLTLRLRYTDRGESEAGVSLPAPSDLDTDFLPHVPALLRAAWKRCVRLRAIAVTVGSLYQPSPQLTLFGDSKRESGALRKLAVTLDGLRRKYGADAVRRGVSEPVVEGIR